MGIYKHGVTVIENPTSMTAPVNGTSGLQVVFGTAPIHTRADYSGRINTPVVAYTYQEAVEKMGYSDDWEKYTLCQSIYVCFKVLNISPIVLVNVLDPAKQSKDVEAISWDGSKNKDYTFASADIVRNTVKVMQGEKELQENVDYVMTADDDGFLTVALIPGSSAYSESGLTITAKEISFAKADLVDDVVGGYSVTEGRNTGISCVHDVYPNTEMTPGLLLAPGFSQYPEVSAALQAATAGINEEFTANAVIDVDCSTEGATRCEDFAKQKEEQCITNSQAVALWPKVKAGGRIFSYSALYAAAVALMDASNGDVPNLSPSNMAIPISATVLEDGTEIRIDKPKANNYVNAYGGVTAIRYQGWKAWGNNTAAYPVTKDPKERWICCRRFFNYYRNRLILTYAEKVDNLTDPRLAEAICDNENVWFNAMASSLTVAGGRVSYDADKNPTSQILDGKVVFTVALATYLPAEDIEFEIEFDPTILQERLSA